MSSISQQVSEMVLFFKAINFTYLKCLLELHLRFRELLQDLVVLGFLLFCVFFMNDLFQKKILIRGCP